MPLSAVDCVQPALQHTRAQLFNPFRFGQWARLALVGILAAEIHTAGCSVPNLGGRWPKIPHRSGQGSLTSTLFAGSSPLDWLPRAPSQISQHIGQYLGLIVIGLVAVMIFTTVFLYLNSVFRFILFDSVVSRECSISRGWARYHQAGKRFFLWQIVLQISTWIFFGLLIGVPLALALAAGWATDLKNHLGRLVVGAILAVGLVLLFALTMGVVQVLAKDFLVPIMALEGLDFADGWNRLLAIMRPEQGRFAIYVLLKIVLSIAAGIIFSIAAIIPIVLIAVPVVLAVLAGHLAGLGWNVPTISLAVILGTMLFLLLFYLIALISVPATIFFPAYALYFFAGRYPDLNLLLNPVPAPQPPLLPQTPPLPQVPPPSEAPPLPPSPEPAV